MLLWKIISSLRNVGELENTLIHLPVTMAGFPVDLRSYKGGHNSNTASVVVRLKSMKGGTGFLWLPVGETESKLTHSSGKRVQCYSGLRDLCHRRAYHATHGLEDALTASHFWDPSGKKRKLNRTSFDSGKRWRISWLAIQKSVKEKVKLVLPKT